MAQQKFAAPRGLEADFRRKLRDVARFIGGIVKEHSDGEGGLVDELGMAEALRRYSELLDPWAKLVVSRLVNQIGTSNLRYWERASVAMGQRLRTSLATTEVGRVARELQAAQVELIKSLPIKAGQRAQSIAATAATSGIRSSDIAYAVRELDRTGEVTEARATLIARTEVAKTHSAITRARADFVGSTHYIWRTMLDAEVRESHAELEGEVFAFDDPPDIEGEGPHGPGEFPNCRCFAEPIIVESQLDAAREGRYQAAGRYDLDI